MEQKPDLKEWIPIYGIYVGIKNQIRGLPSTADDKKLLLLNSAYHAFWATLMILIIIF